MKVNIDDLLIYDDYSIRQTIETINFGANGIAFLVNKEKSLIGTVTDGDIRRALLKGISIEDSIQKFVNYNPIYADDKMTKEHIKNILIKKQIRVIPVLDYYKKIIDIVNIDDYLFSNEKDNYVIIMAGGLGTRLKDLTKKMPKPMLKVGENPMLYHIINNFKQYGYNKMLISVNYKSEIIENYFQDGYAYGAKINYLKEEKRLGTGGGIALAKPYINQDFFVINGDIFTNLNFDKMMEFHKINKCFITVGVRKQSMEIPYGVIEIESDDIINLKEKPSIEYIINGGVYCLNPEIMNFIPENTYFEITELIEICIKNGFIVKSFEIEDYWLDIGRIEDYKKINDDIYELVSVDKIGENNE